MKSQCKNPNYKAYVANFIKKYPMAPVTSDVDDDDNLSSNEDSGNNDINDDSDLKKYPSAKSSAEDNHTS